ncbi:MAG: hypothetical protein Q8O55_08780 [Dehalococcoidales bacterium]|nr:hypothetical protein [Dehalococcoidales bacterium]
MDRENDHNFNLAKENIGFAHEALKDAKTHITNGELDSAIISLLEARLQLSEASCACRQASIVNHPFQSPYSETFWNCLNYAEGPIPLLEKGAKEEYELTLRDLRDAVKKSG